MGGRVSEKPHLVWWGFSVTKIVAVSSFELGDRRQSVRGWAEFLDRAEVERDRRSVEGEDGSAAEVNDILGGQFHVRSELRLFGVDPCDDFFRRPLEHFRIFFPHGLVIEGQVDVDSDDLRLSVVDNGEHRGHFQLHFSVATAGRCGDLERDQPT